MQKKALWPFAMSGIFLPFLTHAMDISLKAVAKKSLHESRGETPHCGLILSQAIRSQATKKLLVKMRQFYRVFRKTYPKEICLMILETAELWEEIFNNPLLSLSRLRCLPSEEIYGLITKKNYLTRQQDRELTLEDLKNIFVEVVKGHILSLAEVRLQVLNRAIQTRTAKEGRSFVDMDSIIDREHFCFGEIGTSKYCNVAFDTKVFERVLNVLYQPHIRMLAGLAPSTSEKDTIAPLNDPTLWTKHLERILSCPIEVSCLSVGLKKRYDRGKYYQMRYIDGQSFETAWIELVRWLDEYNANNFNDDPSYPHHLLTNEKFTARLSEWQNMALFIAVCLADIEQLLHAYQYLYDHEPENRFLQLMAMPHDLLIEWYTCEHSHIGLHTAKTFALHKKAVADGLNLPLKYFSELASRQASEELDNFVKLYRKLETKKRQIALAFAQKHAARETVVSDSLASFYTLFEISRGDHRKKAMQSKIEAVINNIRSARTIHSKLSRELEVRKKESVPELEELRDKENLAKIEVEKALILLNDLRKSRNFDHKYFLEYSKAVAHSNISSDDTEVAK